MPYMCSMPFENMQMLYCQICCIVLFDSNVVFLHISKSVVGII